MAPEAIIRSIFYARFDDDDGPKVLHQVPEGSVIPCPPSPTSMREPLFDFQSISTYLIPIRDFCNRSLSVCSNGYRILGYPICISDESKYERNNFIFNFCIVIDEDAEWTPLKRVVGKLARVFGNLEEQSNFLSKDEEGDTVLVAGTEGYGGQNGSKVFAVVEMVFEDLKAVGEAMIPIDESNTLNLSLFPTRPPPPEIHDHFVPLSVARFASLQTSAWDLTVQRIIPHIDGINSVSRIAQLADTNPFLTRRAIQHLVYYDCVLLLDIFSFSAIYSPTPSISTFIASASMQDECRSYVYSPSSLFGKSSSQIHDLASTPSSTSKPTKPPRPDPSPLPSRTHLIALYLALRPSQPLRDFCLARPTQLANIDVRRLITFGIIKGFLHRSHRYALPLSSTPNSHPVPAVLPVDAARADRPDVPVTHPSLVPGSSGPGPFREASALQTAEKRTADSQHKTARADDVDEHEVAWRAAALSSGWRLPDGRGQGGGSGGGAGRGRRGVAGGGGEGRTAGALGREASGGAAGGVGGGVAGGRERAGAGGRRRGGVGREGKQRGGEAEGERGAAGAEWADELG